MVSTGEGIREWVYYAPSDDAFVMRLNAALGKLRPFPIEIHVARDPKWSYYTEFVASVRSGATAKGERSATIPSGSASYLSMPRSVQGLPSAVLLMSSITQRPPSRMNS